MCDIVKVISKGETDISQLSGILGIQNIRDSNMLAFRAQESQENMMLITKDMHTLALKTKSETVSMRIITLVTLFFSPGTFISVSLISSTNVTSNMC